MRSKVQSIYELGRMVVRSGNLPWATEAVSRPQILRHGLHRRTVAIRVTETRYTGNMFLLLFIHPALDVLLRAGKGTETNLVPFLLLLGRQLLPALSQLFDPRKFGAAA